MRPLSFLLFLIPWEVFAGKALFSSQELERLKKLKYGHVKMFSNAHEYINEFIYELYRTELLILSKNEVHRNKGMTALKELDNIDQHFLYIKSSIESLGKNGDTKKCPKISSFLAK